MNTFGSRLLTVEVALLSLALLGAAVWLALSPHTLAPPPGPPAVAGHIVEVQREAPTSTRAAPMVRVRVAYDVPFDMLSVHWFGGRRLAPGTAMPIVNDLVLPPTDAGWKPGAAVAVWTSGEAPGVATMLGPASAVGAPPPPTQSDADAPGVPAPVAIVAALGLLGAVYAGFRWRRAQLAHAPTIARSDVGPGRWFEAVSARGHEADGVQHDA